MNKAKAIKTMNKLGSNKEAFLFIVNFDMTSIEIISTNELENHNISFCTEELKKANKPFVNNSEITFQKEPISFKQYSNAFKHVHKQITLGNSYLTNLTAETKINTNISLQKIYELSSAPYKLFFKDKFVVFSPETFIKIRDGKISSFPMKGTIDASLANAEESILTNKKEAAEHATITDLIRNDLSTVSTNVKVEKYRYIDRIKTNEGELLQVSSKISGNLPQNYCENIGTILFKLLPAGSISGAPKQKTLKIINNAENYDRGYYTGVFGFFDGKNMDCGVMIRFIEKQGEQLVFKSGGGITINSNAQEEYQELIDKVYLPISIDNE